VNGSQLICMLTEHFRRYKTQTQILYVETTDGVGRTYTVVGIRQSPQGPCLAITPTGPRIENSD
jgi:hypothetical protein